MQRCQVLRGMGRATAEGRGRPVPPQTSGNTSAVELGAVDFYKVILSYPILSYCLNIRTSGKYFVTGFKCYEFRNIWTS